MSIKIDEAALRRIEKKLGSITEMNRRAREPMEQSLEVLRAELSKPPKKSPSAFSKLATPGQRRAYFAKMSKFKKESGNWGYDRTNTLIRSWTYKPPRRLPNGLRGEIGTNNPYAKWVQKAGSQQPFHLISGWITDKRAARENKDKILKIWQRWMNKELSK
jgi:hypothetical protein